MALWWVWMDIGNSVAQEKMRASEDRQVKRAYGNVFGGLQPLVRDSPFSLLHLPSPYLPHITTCREYEEMNNMNITARVSLFLRCSTNVTFRIFAAQHGLLNAFIFYCAHNKIRSRFNITNSAIIILVLRRSKICSRVIVIGNDREKYRKKMNQNKMS